MEIDYILVKMNQTDFIQHPELKQYISYSGMFLNQFVLQVENSHQLSHIDEICSEFKIENEVLNPNQIKTLLLGIFLT